MKQKKVTFLTVLSLFLFGIMISSSGLAQSSDPAYMQEPWVQLGGPPGGLGYDIRMQPDNPDIMYVTDAGGGVFKSTDGGQNWVLATMA